MIILMAAMMIGMYFLGGRMMHGSHKKEKVDQESHQSQHHEIKKSTMTVKDTDNH